MLEAGMEAFGHESVRDPRHRTNIGLFAPQALASTKPTSLERAPSRSDGRSVQHSAAGQFPHHCFGDRPVTGLAVYLLLYQIYGYA